jgi:hypothetical protein
MCSLHKGNSPNRNRQFWSKDVTGQHWLIPEEDPYTYPMLVFSHQSRYPPTTGKVRWIVSTQPITLVNYGTGIQPKSAFCPHKSILHVAMLGTGPWTLVQSMAQKPSQVDLTVKRTNLLNSCQHGSSSTVPGYNL